MTDISTRKTGNIGETVACDYIVRHGYIVVRRNYRYKGGEIDIIAEDDKYIAFIEVKLRRRNAELAARYGRPSAAVTKAKQSRIIAGIKLYLRETECDKQPRADVMEITYDEAADGSADFEINHIKGAFTK